MDFKNAKELLDLCAKEHLSISEVMKIREIQLAETTEDIVDTKMDRVFSIMKKAAFSPLENPVKSMGGLIGGESQKLNRHLLSGNGMCGELLEKAITYAMATLETNASMGLIVASPTAGSAGIVPGLLLALQKVYDLTDDQIKQLKDLIDTLDTPAYGDNTILTTIVTDCIGSILGDDSIDDDVAQVVKDINIYLSE